MTARRPREEESVDTGAAPATRTLSVDSPASGALAAVSFLLEVAMLAAFCYWGFHRTAPWNLVLGLGVPAAVVVLWGAFVAPQAVRRLPSRAVVWVSLGLFLLAAAALATAGPVVLAVLLAAVAVVHAIAVAVRMRRQPRS